jgi:chemotaxis protein CheY-P-specific phosphatase CheC
MDQERISTILSDLGGKGAKSAAKALSDLILQEITMDVPRVLMVDPIEIPEILPFQGQQTVFIIEQMSREHDSDIVLVFTVDEAKKLVNIVMENLGLDEIDVLDVLDEIGNILLGNFVNPFSDHIDEAIKPSTPAHIVDFFDAIINNYVTKLMYQDIQATLFDTSLKCGETDIKGSILMFLDEELQDEILSNVGDIPHTVTESSEIYVNSIQ